MITRFHPITAIIILTLSNCSVPGLPLSTTTWKQCLFVANSQQFICSIKRTGKVFYAGNMKYVNNNYHKDGVGTEYFNNGDIYIGEWKMGERHGQGSYKVPDKTTCSSKWLNDKQSGIVSCLYSGEHAGHIREGLTDGAGNWVKQTIYTFPDGKKVEEYWENGKLIQQIDI